MAASDARDTPSDAAAAAANPCSAGAVTLPEMPIVVSALGSATPKEYTESSEALALRRLAAEECAA